VPTVTLRFTVTQAGGNDCNGRPALRTVSAKKLLYVVDTLANRVHAFWNERRLCLSFGSGAMLPGGSTSDRTFFRSTAGELYVTDALNFRIEIFDEVGLCRGRLGAMATGPGDLAMPKGLVADRDGGRLRRRWPVRQRWQLFDRRGTFLLTGRQARPPISLNSGCVRRFPQRHR